MRRRAVVFALSYLCAILYLSLYPGTFLDAPVASGLHWVVPEGRRAILDTLLNLLFYMPFGLAIGLAVGNWRISVPVVALLSGACSLAVEWAQLWTITRHGNLLDWGTNTFGACVGAAGAALVARLAEQPGSAALLVRWKLAPVQQLFTVTWLSWFALPFVPRISLPNAINQVIHPASWVWRDFETAMGGFAVLRVILGPSPWLYIDRKSTRLNSSH